MSTSSSDDLFFDSNGTPLLRWTTIAPKDQSLLPAVDPVTWRLSRPPPTPPSAFTQIDFLSIGSVNGNPPSQSSVTNEPPPPPSETPRKRKKSTEPDFVDPKRLCPDSDVRIGYCFCGTTYRVSTSQGPKYEYCQTCESFVSADDFVRCVCRQLNPSVQTENSVIEWISCDKCNVWQHLDCVGWTIDKDSSADYLCSYCTAKTSIWCVK